MKPFLLIGLFAFSFAARAGVTATPTVSDVFNKNLAIEYTGKWAEGSCSVRVVDPAPNEDHRFYAKFYTDEGEPAFLILYKVKLDNGMWLTRDRYGLLLYSQRIGTIETQLLADSDTHLFKEFLGLDYDEEGYVKAYHCKFD